MQCSGGLFEFLRDAAVSASGVLPLGLASLQKASISLSLFWPASLSALRGVGIWSVVSLSLQGSCFGSLSGKDLGFEFFPSFERFDSETDFRIRKSRADEGVHHEGSG